MEPTGSWSVPTWTRGGSLDVALVREAGFNQVFVPEESQSVFEGTNVAATGGQAFADLVTKYLGLTDEAEEKEEEKGDDNDDDDDDDDRHGGGYENGDGGNSSGLGDGPPGGAQGSGSDGDQQEGPDRSVALQGRVRVTLRLKLRVRIRS